MSQPMKIVIGLLALVVVLMIASMTVFIRVRPWHYGIKQNLIANTIEAEPATTGFALRIPGVHKWHMIERRTHFITFAEGGYDTDRGKLGMRRDRFDSNISTFLPPMELRTKDGNPAFYDLTVTYQVIPEEASLIVEEGNAANYRDLVVGIVTSTLRDELAEMSSEEIFVTERRLAVARAALPVLTEALKKNHVRPDQVLIRAVRFGEEYENGLQRKQLTYQNSKLAEAETLVENERGKTESSRAEIAAAEKELRGDRDKDLQEVRSANEVAIAQVQAEANVYDQRVRAQADAAYETAIANGRLALEKAEALRNELRNQALDTRGGRIYLAQQAAENLDFESVTLNSNDPRVPSVIDIGAMVRLLIGEE